MVLSSVKGARSPNLAVGAGLATSVWANVPGVSRTNILCTVAFGRPKVAPIDHLDRVGPITPSYAKAQPGSPFLRLNAPARSGRIGLGELPLSMRRSAKLEKAIGTLSSVGEICLASHPYLRTCGGSGPSPVTSA